MIFDKNTRRMAPGRAWPWLLLGALLASCADDTSGTPDATVDGAAVDGRGDVAVDRSRTDSSGLPPLTTCESERANCGAVGDGRGGRIECGSCAPPEFCGGGGPSRCGRGVATDAGPPCISPTCASLGLNCGPVSDRCGGTMECGTCGAGEACGVGGRPNVCASVSGVGDGGVCVARTCASLGVNCGPVSDGCGRLLDCGTCASPQFCGGGGVPNVCGGSRCVARTCADAAANCGSVADGCGGLLSCGTCVGAETCGGGGLANRCGTPGSGPSTCVARTCASANANCGPVADGCGGLLECGTCASGTTCGGGGVPSRCGSGGGLDGGLCVPRTCASASANCGPVADGCGALLACGDCTGGATCGGGGVPSRCGAGGGLDAGLCVRRTCATAGADCGPVSDGCGGILDCGMCAGANTCGGGGVASRCGTTPCTRRTCASVGANCGPVADGCGGLLDCGNCVAPQTCGGGGTPSVCGSSSTPPGCTGLCLRRASCAPGVVTTISGTVRTPARTSPDPLPRAVVYIPNAPVPDFAPGVACDRCSDTHPGSPVVSALTGPDGRFVLRDVPVGANIPLVIEIGRWRRQITISTVNPCVDNALTSEQTRMPRNRTEGNIPLMAMVTGTFDAFECLLRKIGIDESEFTAPSGGGRVQFYFSNGGVARGGATPGYRTLFNATALNRYDMVILACEGSEIPKATADKAALVDYTNRGGRVFATHFSYTWLWDIAPFSGVASWLGDQPLPTDSAVGRINTSFERGRDFSAWLSLVGATSGPDEITIAHPRQVVDTERAPATRWIDTRTTRSLPATVQQLTVNTPVGAAPESTCGRVLYSAFHVDHFERTEGMVFPDYCDSGPLTAEEKVLEFMIFDLAACIAPDMPGPVTCARTTCAAAGANCGPIADGCGSTLDCGTCPAGQTCGGGGVASRCGSTACRPRTCRELSLSCGPAGNGCGGTLDCGACPPGTTCGGGGTPGACGMPACRPRTCADQNLQCGPAGNGCGGTLDCGLCPAGTTCGGGGTPGVCGSVACRPTTCAAQGIACGPAGDGCGGTLFSCGTCPPGMTCGGGGRPGVCGTPPCVRQTCAAQDLQCGPAGDGCGGTLDCGTCAMPLTCGGGGVRGRCGAMRCTPVSCVTQGIECGPAGDGCGGTQTCGECPGGMTCGGGGRPGVCGTRGCTPQTCASQNLRCGPAGDGCGGRIASCGECPPGEICGGGGPGVCGRGACVPHTCAERGANCGIIADGCGGTLDCGTCTAPDTCGGGNRANLCGSLG